MTPKQKKAISVRMKAYWAARNAAPDVAPMVEDEPAPNRSILQSYVEKYSEKLREGADEARVNHPAHYTNHPSGVECIQITEHLNFCLGNAIKYIWRADAKNGLEDLKKAAWYINREIERRNHA